MPLVIETIRNTKSKWQHTKNERERNTFPERYAWSIAIDDHPASISTCTIRNCVL